MQLGFHVYVIDGTEQIGDVLDEIQTALLPGLRGALYQNPPYSRITAGYGPWKNSHNAHGNF